MTTTRKPRGEKPATATSAKGATKRKPAQPKPKRPTGRPTTFTQELADLICERIAQGNSMRTVCKDEGMPALSSVFKWLREHPSFSEQYDVACAERAQFHQDEMLDIADDGTNDWMEIHDKDGECIGYKLNGEAVQRSRLRIDTRKWLMSKLQPKKFGDKVDLNHGVQPDNPLATLFGQLSGKTLKPGTLVDGEDD